MQIQQAKSEELGLLITGLKAIYVADQEKLRVRLLEQLENELSTRYGLKIADPGVSGADVFKKSA